MEKQTELNDLNQRKWEVFGFYFLFGALHEIAHVLTAFFTNQSGGLISQGIVPFLIRTLLLRQCNLAELEDDFYGDLVRHSGWSASLLFLYLSRNNKNALLAASLTALEALSTDLLRIVPTLPNKILFCGNFGIIMLHKAWSSNGATTALDILEKMVQVTMMRGAQSGGVVAFHCKEKQDAIAVRSRVVNAKRTDLSKKIRKKIEKDVSLKGGDIPFFFGHTRFATSSKATFSGTHPHQWTAPTNRRVYEFNEPRSGERSIEPSQTRIENYITHNGDFDFYNINGTTFDLEVIQNFLSNVLGPMPAAVDSCAIAGVIDLLRTKGCFGLSARYVVCFELSTSTMQLEDKFPPYDDFEKIGLIFEEVFSEILKDTNIDQIDESSEIRQSFSARVLSRLENQSKALIYPLEKYLVEDNECGTSLHIFCLKTVDAFFDNDLFFATKTFLKNAKGSFGLCVTSSLDAKRQIALAARGQAMSIAFYPRKGLICYGSEQAAVKAGLDYEFPGDSSEVDRTPCGEIDDDTLRLDLDDLNGEILLLDWGQPNYKNSPLGNANRDIIQHELMNGSVSAILFQESKASSSTFQLYNRMTRLTRNRFIKPLPPDCPDPVLRDIRDIPKACFSIQNEWQVDEAAKSLNRLTAFNLSRCLRRRLDAHIKGSIHPKAIDILLTGCEVSLWLAEQFASDMQKSFPELRIKAVSSNKLLGLYGQELPVPSFGFSDAPATHHLHDTIVIIVSHSGGTFAPLSCSNLLQSTTKNLFVITSEWDTQIGKQLRAMDALDDDEVHIFNSRIFSTEVGMRTAEPCSISVVATHQLLTNLFEYICVIILSDSRYRKVTNAIISERDLEILEKCNQKNIEALCDIVSATGDGMPYVGENSDTTHELCEMGNLWAEHILENARAYIITFIYVFATVVSGYPLIYGIAVLCNYSSSKWIYLIRLFDAAIYFWMPQINITIIRLIQGRNLRHRMVGRTVVIGDIPWVAQAADAFLSKLFACSYSIAGLNVLSGNPADHFVHRHTHRVVRGSLVICGRPDGRLSALSTAEASVCLAVNQTSSIQSLGGTCESITIGHNPFKLPLTKSAIILRRKRPLFLCERLLVENDVKEENMKLVMGASLTDLNNQRRSISLSEIFRYLKKRRERRKKTIDSSSHHNCSVRPKNKKRRSALALLGTYTNIDNSENKENTIPLTEEEDVTLSVRNAIKEAIEEKKWSDNARKLFTTFDSNGDGLISFDEFKASFHFINTSFSDEDISNYFQASDLDGTGYLDYEEFQGALEVIDRRCAIALPLSNRNERGLIEIEASQERYFGQILRKHNAGKSKKDVDFLLTRNQHFSQELYETRIASLQRFVAMTVMFHHMGKRVQEFFVNISFGLLGYRMDRTHSILRIATTASPVSGADVRERMRYLQLLKKVRHSVHVISTAYIRYKNSAGKNDD